MTKQKQKNRFQSWSILALFSLLLIFKISLIDKSLGGSHQTFDSWDDIRLPTLIVPTNYKLNFTTDLKDGSYAGAVSIMLDLQESSKFVVVHSLGLDISFKGMTQIGGASFDILKKESKTDMEYVVYYFQKLLPKGSYELRLEYHGALSTSLQGYYLSTYYDDHGVAHSLATTQHEPTDARRSFPCLDEPGMKATFDITIKHRRLYHALSNMPIKRERMIDAEWTETTFDRTVKMSTYLVAFIVSDFESISAKTSNGIKVSVWTAPKKTHLGEYALKVGVPIIEWYQSTFGIEYPLPKMDMIAIPDFSAGAMENWGLITYRDTALLYDKETSTSASKQRVATVVGHELAHQWFGNLVTMKWWSDLWLNEGFAEFMEYKAVDHVEPFWNMSAQFIPLDLVRALHADESIYTHQIAIPVKNPNEISSIFDDISYGKGSSVLRMLQSWMDEKYGENTFFHKLNGYLTKFAYSNAETGDLWDALKTPDQNISQFMKTWTDQPGFPFLNFSQVTANDFTVKQSRFIFASLLEESNIESLKSQIWSVPLSYAIYANSTGTAKRITRGFTEISKLGDVAVSFQQPIPDDAVLLANYLQTGVYRSLYDSKTYRYIIDWLNKDLELLPNVERGGLISDVFSQTFAGHLKDPTIALDLSKILAKDSDILVWLTALKDLESLKNVFALDPLYGSMVEYQTGLIEKVLGSVGWIENDPKSKYAHSRSLVRGRLLSEAIRNNHEETVAVALKYFQDIKNGKQLNLPPEAYPAIYDAGVIYGNLNDYIFVQERFQKCTFQPDCQILLHALGATRTPYLQARTLNFAISGKVRKQDIQTAISNVVNLSPVGHITTWIFLMDNWERVTQMFSGTGFGHFNDLLESITSSFTKHYLIDEAERLFVVQSDPDFYVPPGAKTSVLKGLETAKQLLAWKSLYSEKVGDWLDRELNQ